MTCRSKGLSKVGACTAAFNQKAFRGRNDDGTEATATWKAAQNTNFSQIEDTAFRIRFEVQETAGCAKANFTTIQLQRNLNSAGWVNVTASSTVVASVASPNVADGAATTNQLTVGTGTFVGGGGFDEVNGVAGSNLMDVAASGHFEVEYSIQLLSAGVNPGDTVQLRVTDGGTAFAAYDATPTVTVTGNVIITSSVPAVAKLSASLTLIVGASASLKAQADLAATAVLTIPITASIKAPAVGKMAEPQAVKFIEASIAAPGRPAAPLILTVPVTAAIRSPGAVAASVILTVPVTAAIRAPADHTATIVLTVPVTASIKAASAMASSVILVVPVTASMGAQADISASATLTVPISASIRAPGAAGAALVLTIPFTATIATPARPLASVVLIVPAPAVLSAAGRLSAALTLIIPTTATIAAPARPGVPLVLTVPVTATIAAVGDLAADVTVVGGGPVTVTITASIGAPASIRPAPAVIEAPTPPPGGPGNSYAPFRRPWLLEQAQVIPVFLIQPVKLLVAEVTAFLPAPVVIESVRAFDLRVELQQDSTILSPKVLWYLYDSGVYAGTAEMSEQRAMEIGCLAIAGVRDWRMDERAAQQEITERELFILLGS